MRAFVVLLMLLPLVWCEQILLLDITPEEAQKYISAQSLDLKYAPKLGEQPLVALRNLDGGQRNFYRNGKIIENPEDYIEEEYLASQFHGQDGLGRFMFGYKDWNQARVEAGNANQEVRGSYQYVDPNGEDFKVEYWADSLGFHQTDNRPKIVLEPVTDTPEVREARKAHEEAWKEAAIAAKAYPDSNSDYYNRNANKQFEEQARLEQAQLLLESQSAPQETQYEYKRRPEEIEEVTGEPRGFFYSFDYPVQLIVESPNSRALKEKQLHKRENQPAEEVKETPEKTEEVKPEPAVVAAVETPEKTPAIATVPGSEVRLSLKAAEGGLIPIDAVHDTQVHPNQNVENSQVLPVLIHE